MSDPDIRYRLKRIRIHLTYIDKILANNFLLSIRFCYRIEASSDPNKQGLGAGAGYFFDSLETEPVKKKPAAGAGKKTQEHKIQPNKIIIKAKTVNNCL